jgi:hypothetical protein
MFWCDRITSLHRHAPLVAGIRVFLGRLREKGVDGRDEPGHDSERQFTIIGIRFRKAD